MWWIVACVCNFLKLNRPLQSLTLIGRLQTGLLKEGSSLMATPLATGKGWTLFSNASPWTYQEEPRWEGERERAAIVHPRCMHTCRTSSRLLYLLHSPPFPSPPLPKGWDCWSHRSRQVFSYAGSLPYH